ncbi:MAG: hypothetical protein GY715_03950 [Planctomycetes bacterium]|nr:hypothetical protein [Planctomycetota bacterium]
MTHRNTSACHQLATFVLSFACSLSAAVAAADQEHGISFGVDCESPLFVGDPLSCWLGLGYDDDFLDTIEILEAYFVVDPLGEAIRVPPAGNLGVAAVSGNSTAVVGGALPVHIGPTGSTLGGLPGLPAPGFVGFELTGIVIEPEHADPLPVQAIFRWRDLCDAEHTDACSSLPSMVTWASAADIVHPDLDIDGHTVPGSLCPARPDTAVDFVFSVPNEGDIALENVIVIDDACDTLTGPDGDVDGDGILDVAEEFMDLDHDGTWDPGEPIVGDNGNGVWDDAETWIYTCPVVTALPVTHTAIATASPVGRPDIVLERSVDVALMVCAADLDCSGVVGFGDILAVVGAWGPCPPGSCIADLDVSGDVDFGDIVAVVEAWGTCP